MNSWMESARRSLLPGLEGIGFGIGTGTGTVKRGLRKRKRCRDLLAFLCQRFYD